MGTIFNRIWDKLPYEKVVGSLITDLIHRDSKLEFDNLFKEALSGKSHGEVNLYIKERIIPVYISLTSLQPKLATVGIIITDHTAKKKNEETILQYQKELEAKNIELAQNNVELTSFTHIASHDLQEPLRKIQTFCNRILDNADEELSSTSQDYFNRILTASKRMQNLINSLLNYSRMNTRSMEYEEVDLNVIVDEVKGNLQDLFEENNVTFESDNLPVIKGVPQQFNQLITNLIINSVKYKRRNVPPYIRIKAEQVKSNVLINYPKETDSDFWKLTISDNGIGFEQQYADKIFELFQRLHTRFEYEGTGIGLAICKKVVQNHKGIIRATGIPGSGASFEIYLPKDPVA